MAHPANVFSEDYRIGFKAQQVWSVPHALEFFLLGTGAGLYLFSTWFSPFALGQLVGELTVIAAGMSLMVDLGQPKRLWRTFANLGFSWISRGALSVFVFLAAALMGTAARWLNLFPSLPSFPLACEVIASLSALVTMLYPGLVLSSYASIPSWNSPMVPLLFFVYSWTTGLAAEWVILLFSGMINRLALSLESGFLLISFTLISLLTHLGGMARGSVAVKEGFRLLTRGSLSGWFIGGVLCAGLLLPLLIIGAALVNREINGLSLLISAILVLSGGFFFRYCILKAGIYPPLF